MTRKHVHQEVFAVTPERLFALLHTPSDIRRWWGVSRAIVLAEPGGMWAATWGESEDDPDYVTIATLRDFDPPRRITFADMRYRARSGPLPFKADFVTEFVVQPHPGGALLRVTQDGFPTDPVADDFYAACGTGWKNTFAGIRRVVEGPG
jgi:uncharacterized protein YndB with AHSA1/START domain